MTVMPKDKGKGKSPRKITDTFKKQKSTNKLRQHNKPQPHDDDVVASTSTATSTTLISEKDLSILRDFDLDWQFGPCLGITRIERWERARKNGLNPPEHVIELIENNSTNDSYTQCIWADYKQL
ncbi:DNA polymerase delta subunit 4-like isoform X2 [Tubulanus polymorphus]|uniref:DNA polymerase delta subunit 4-like isoform X2 n=1 Tax=Tubulanus polymorphus TaxID=672921 RepID=UPI003DA3F363